MIAHIHSEKSVKFTIRRRAMNGVIDSIRTATESSVAVQHEMFKKWMTMWPGALVSSSPFGEPQKFQKKWVEVGCELLKKQNVWLEAQFKTGLRTIEDAFRLAGANDSEELRTGTINLWQKTFDCLWQNSQAQLRGLHDVLAKWTELMNKSYLPAGQPFRAPEVSEAKPEGGEKRRIPAIAKSDRAELEEAMMEYEMTKGDWSKGR
jgi:hypothetical protein